MFWVTGACWGGLDGDGFRFCPDAVLFGWFGVCLVYFFDMRRWMISSLDDVGIGSVRLSWCFRHLLSGGCLGAGWDEPESLILAQSERWRHA